MTTKKEIQSNSIPQGISHKAEMQKLGELIIFNLDWANVIKKVERNE